MTPAEQVGGGDSQTPGRLEGTSWQPLGLREQPGRNRGGARPPAARGAVPPPPAPWGPVVTRPRPQPRRTPVRLSTALKDSEASGAPCHGPFGSFPTRAAGLPCGQRGGRQGLPLPELHPRPGLSRFLLSPCGLQGCLGGESDAPSLGSALGRLDARTPKLSPRQRRGEKVPDPGPREGSSGPRSSQPWGCRDRTGPPWQMSP